MAIRHTVCIHCSQDIEGESRGTEWRDRGNNTHCPNALGNAGLTHAARATQKTARDRDACEAKVYLLELIKPGDTVYTVLRDVSRSGMSRNIDCYVMVDGRPQWISRVAARACGLEFNEKRECIRIGGCGMDMGFAIVYDLSSTLFPNGFECIGAGGLDTSARRCCSNDHSNGDREYGAHWHKSGGYALRHSWM